MRCLLSILHDFLPRRIGGQHRSLLRGVRQAEVIANDGLVGELGDQGDRRRRRCMGADGARRAMAQCERLQPGVLLVVVQLALVVGRKARHLGEGGGHLLDYQLENGVLTFGEIHKLMIDLPADSAFLQANLHPSNLDAAIRSVEN